MNHIIDSSAWIEYFADTKYAKYVSNTIERSRTIIIPSITIFEVFKKLLKEKDKHIALQIVAHMRRGDIIDLDSSISLLAAQLAHTHNIPMADSIILATAQKHTATIWTFDSDFRNIPNVKYFPKK
jgi:toxin FitB